MGNCLFGGGIDDVNEVIKVVTSNGGIMEFYAPITVKFITDEFPGHGIFRSHDLFWKPLPHQELLQAGEYYLLPLEESGLITQVGHVRSNSVDPQTSLQLAAPYRMSNFDSQGILKRSQTEVINRCSNGRSGFWKVKLVISPQQLLEILSQETRTQELIENVRTVAKCAKCGSGVSSRVSSDQWSLSSSSRNASSKKDFLLEL